MTDRARSGLDEAVPGSSGGPGLARLLEQSETRFRAVFESSADCLFYVQPDASGRLVYQAVNACGIAHVGRPWADVEGRAPDDVMGPGAGDIIAANLAEVFRTGEPYRYQPTMPMARGEVVFDALYSPVRDRTGQVIGVLGSARDITQQRRMEALLHQSAKMDALGTLAGGVAHDFNNLLGSLQACLELLGRDLPAGRGTDILAEAARVIERGTSLTGRLLAFSRMQPRQMRPVRLTECLRGLRDTLQRTLGGHCTVALDLADDLWATLADQSEAELAIINLAVNARDAMAEGGTLTLRSRNVVVGRSPEETPLGDAPLGDAPLGDAPSGELAPGSYVCIDVADTGIGMEADVLSQAAAPFYTTKPAGEGTGLGLSNVAHLMRELNGHLEIRSDPGAGTCVSLYFQATDAPAA